MKKYLALILLIILASCTNDRKSPEEALKSFVELRFESVLTKEALLERVTGKLRQAIQNTSVEDFKKSSDMSNMQKDSFKILTQECQDKQCFITYAISYTTKQDDKAQYSTDVKKIAELQKEDGKWLIADVSNVKTTVEAMEPINPLQ